MNPHLFPPSRLARSVLRTQSDERLIELSRLGSDAAFEAIVGRYRLALVRRCHRVLGDGDAEEAVQDALLKAHQALLRGDRVHNLPAWLHAIAYNASLNVLRSRATRPEPSRVDPVELSEPENDVAQRRADLHELLDAIQSLPVRQRDAIVMRELEGRSYEEIAAELGATKGAVRQLLGRARAAIRERFGVLAGAEPLVSWLTSASTGGATARLGALAGSCTVAAKLCASALLPAVIAAGVQSVSVQPPRPATVHRATRHRSAEHGSRVSGATDPAPPELWRSGIPVPNPNAIVRALPPASTPRLATAPRLSTASPPASTSRPEPRPTAPSPRDPPRTNRLRLQPATRRATK